MFMEFLKFHDNRKVLIRNKYEEKFSSNILCEKEVIHQILLFELIVFIKVLNLYFEEEYLK